MANEGPGLSRANPNKYRSRARELHFLQSPNLAESKGRESEVCYDTNFANAVCSRNLY